MAEGLRGHAAAAGKVVAQATFGLLICCGCFVFRVKLFDWSEYTAQQYFAERLLVKGK